jgi:hypothetical protein
VIKFKAQFCYRKALPMKVVARWFIFRPKIGIWAHLGQSCNVRCWCRHTYNGHLVRFMSICYILWQFGMFFTCFNILYQDESVNLATYALPRYVYSVSRFYFPHLITGTPTPITQTCPSRSYIIRMYLEGLSHA